VRDKVHKQQADNGQKKASLNTNHATVMQIYEEVKSKSDKYV
jgi:hypothetical protein